MRILHIGDLHIGKLVHGIHMTKDQKHVLEQIIEIIDKENIDVLLIAGDIYDRSVPPVEAVDLLDDFLSEIIIKNKTKIIAIAGNHDSPDRVGFVSKILKDRGLHIVGNYETSLPKIEVEDEYGIINFYPIPFVEPAVVRILLEDDKIKSYDDAMKKTIENMNVDYSQRNICIAHGFIVGVESLVESESERPLSVGGSDYVNVDYFKDFDYVALGHLHKPQRVKHDYIRYSGSLLKYSFSEARQKKSVTIVDFNSDGFNNYEQIYLEPLRDMRIIKGKLKNLIDPKVYMNTNLDDYIMAILEDEGELVNTISTIRSVYPNVLRIEKEKKESNVGENKTSASEDFIKKDPLELFCEFYENLSGELFTDEKKDIIATIFNEISNTGRNS